MHMHVVHTHTHTHTHTTNKHMIAHACECFTTTLHEFFANLFPHRFQWTANSTILKHSTVHSGCNIGSIAMDVHIANTYICMLTQSLLIKLAVNT